MRRIKRAEIREAAERVTALENPYIAQSIEFYIDRKKVYLFANDIYTEEQLKEEYTKTARKDIEAGYKDRAVGYYDKWYRYSRADGGRAYDAGVLLATSVNDDCPKDMRIIECVH